MQLEMKLEKEIQAIHESLVNGNRSQMTEQIEEYGIVDFCIDYKTFLDSHWTNILVNDLSLRYEWFTDAIISYHRTKG